MSGEMATQMTSFARQQHRVNLTLFLIYIAMLVAALFVIVTLRYVTGYDKYRDGIYYKTSAGLRGIPGDIPAEAKQVQLYNNVIGKYSDVICACVV